jgi:hypothetical protein
MINRKQLPQDVQDMLDKLLNKSDLTPDEIAFLHARSPYLTESELKSIPKIEEAEIVEEKPKKSKRKFLK